MAGSSDYRLANWGRLKCCSLNNPRFSSCNSLCTDKLMEIRYERTFNGVKGNYFGLFCTAFRPPHKRSFRGGGALSWFCLMQRLIAWRKGPQLLSSDAFAEAVGSEAVSLKQLSVVQLPSVMVSNYTWRGFVCVCVWAASWTELLLLADWCGLHAASIQCCGQLLLLAVFWSYWVWGFENFRWQR